MVLPERFNACDTVFNHFVSRIVDHTSHYVGQQCLYLSAKTDGHPSSLGLPYIRRYAILEMFVTFGPELCFPYANLRRGKLSSQTLLTSL